MKEIIEQLERNLKYHSEKFTESLDLMHHHQAQMLMYKEAIQKLKDEQ